MADTLGQDNPFRYRGYYYDTESGLYYLQSRYYDPVTFRFLNADGLFDTNTGILSHNMFIYCLNNPVMNIDNFGNCPYRFDGFWGHYGVCKDSMSMKPLNPTKPTTTVKPSGTYNDGKSSIYITTQDKVKEVNAAKKRDDVVIVDGRKNPNPNMKVEKSYQIKKIEYQTDIILSMLDYNNSNPVNPAWKRTESSLLKEWEIHNNMYTVGYKRDRTADTDFDNLGEGKGYWDYFQEALS